MKRSFLFFLTTLFLSHLSFAREINVVKMATGEITINLSAYQTGRSQSSRTFLSVLKADLNRSGHLRVTSSKAAINVTGKCAANSTTIQTSFQLYNAATRRRLMGKKYTQSTKKTRALAHKIADEILFAVTGKKGMASGKITMVSNRTKYKELYICDMDGSNIRQITKDRSIAVAPRWAPNGKAIVYTSYKRGYPSVFLTGRAKPLSSYRGLNTGGAISPDGHSMAVILSVSGNPELYVISLRTGAVKRMTRTRRGNEASPCWSPDGSKIAFVSDTSGSPQIYIISKSGGRVKRLSSGGSENVAPDWGKNGIVYSTRQGGRYKIAIADPVRKKLKVLQTDWADYEDPSWAPDQRHIVCSRTLKYHSSIYLLDTVKDSPVRLIKASGDWFSPACSP